MIGMKAKRLFFDTKAVRSKVDKATRRVLSKFGAFVRRSAKSSIRKRRRVSAPGQPPSSHTGLLKRFIFFSYDPSQRSVVIGPERLTSKMGTAPEALEYGGRSQVAGGRQYDKRSKSTKVIVRQRPFMGPAFEKEKPKLPEMWKNSVR